MRASGICAALARIRAAPLAMKGLPEQALTIVGADWFNRRGGPLPTTRDIREPTVYYWKY